MMTNRLQALINLGHKLSHYKDKSFLDKLPDDLFFEKGHQIIEMAKHYNPWFLEEQVIFALQSWANALTAENLTKWINENGMNEPDQPKKVGLILAGNLPMVGFHDIISVFISGHIAQIKLSSQDKHLMPWLIDFIVSENSAFQSQFTYVERLTDFDAVIATGSNNSAHYFDFYFSKVPNIIRRNRHSVAILTGDESQEELALLGQDIFQYFGLGCRNVTKLYVPENYTFDHFFEAIAPYDELMVYEKYASNYHYNKAVFLMSQDKFLDNGFLTLKEDDHLTSPISTLFYTNYNNIGDLSRTLELNKDQIQCVVSKINLPHMIPFGQTQKPNLWDYADDINTLAFLNNL
jgi:hypothetical protein